MKSQSELKEENKDLRHLIQTSLLLNSPMPLNPLLSLIMKISKKVMRAEAATLMLVDELKGDLVYEVALGEKGRKIKKLFRLKMGQGVAGWVAQQGKPALVEDASKDPRFFSKVDKKSGFKTHSILCVPLKVEEKVIGILQALNPTQKKFFDKKDLELFEVFSAQVSVAVAKARWHEKTLHQQKMQQDLDVARVIQKNFLSKESFSLGGMQFHAKYEPANTVGGDFYDCVVLGPKKAVMMLGDVSGKGVAAALYMVKTVTEFRNLVWKHFPDVGKVMSALNKVLNEHSTFGMFVTAVMLGVDLEKNEMLICNAGHLPPLLYRKRTKKVDLIAQAHEPPLGILKGISYSSFSRPLSEGDRILLYTDGLTETRNKKEEEFGMNRLMRALREAIKANKEERVLPHVLSKVKQFGNRNDFDDKTVVLVGR